VRRCIIDDDLTNEETKTQTKLREVAREQKGKTVKIRYRKIQINEEWFISDEREEKPKKNFQKKERRRQDEPARKGIKRS
jgi:hypothetical protein